MKFTKKMAAMIAGMMTIAAMGGMTAFAESNTITNESDKRMDLPLTVTSDLEIETVYQSTPTWNVEVSAQALTWSLSGTKTNTYTLEWNPTTKSYTPGDPVETYSEGTGTFEKKTVTFTNKSNFDVSAEAEVEGQFILNTSSNVSIPGAGGTGSFEITPSSGLREATTGEATFTFTKTGGLIQYNSNAVTDTSAGG